MIAPRVVFRAGWLPASVLLAHAVLSALRAYGVVPGLDMPVHAAGGFAIAYASAQVIEIRRESGAPGRVDEPYRSALVVSLTASAAVVWELVEFVSDEVVGTAAQRGLEDTLRDLLLGIVGGLAFLAFDRLRRA